MYKDSVVAKKKNAEKIYSKEVTHSTKRRC
jgi:hypothetical protein